MGSLPPTTFASLLRRYRQAAGLTQEELAERARLSIQAIGALERGDRQSPRKETIALLAEALALTEPERAAFEAAARQQRVANPTTSTPPTPEALPLEPTQLPEEHVLLPSGPLSPVEAVPPAWSSLLRRRSKLLARLVSVLLLLTGLLAGIHAFSRGGTLCLATDFTTSGDFASTTPLQRAVNLAVTQNQHLGNGYQLQVSNYHDPPPPGDSGPSTGAHNIQQIAQDPCTVGIVGPFVSAVAAAEMPIAANAGLVMISPSNTYPGLTLRPYAEVDGYNFDQLHPPGKPLNYFRIAPTHVIEGVVDADFTLQTLGARSVYVVSERTPYGEELADGFTQRFEVKGGRIVGTDGIPNGNASVIADLAARIAATDPEAVFYGGFVESGAGLLKAQLVHRGYTGSFVGGDGIALEPPFVTQAGAKAANGTFASDSAFNLGFSTSVAAAQFIRAYSARYPGKEYLTPYTAEAYDAAMVLITAIKQLIEAGQPVTRAAMLEQVQHIQYAGVIGPISFDENGDITHGVFTMYTVQAGQWVYFQQLSA